jgi:hypothetical protein
MLSALSLRVGGLGFQTGKVFALSSENQRFMVPSFQSRRPAVLGALELWVLRSLAPVDSLELFCHLLTASTHARGYKPGKPLLGGGVSIIATQEGKGDSTKKPPTLTNPDWKTACLYT